MAPLSKKANRKGQALVELALVLPVLLIIVGAIIDFGWLFANELTVGSACREGARYGAVNSDAADRLTAIEARAISMMPGYSAGSVTVTSAYSGGDVRVTVAYDCPLLTPFLQIIMGSERTRLSETCVMKTE